MAQDTNINNLIINKLTKQQFDSITTPNPTQLYFVTDDNGIESLDNVSISNVANGQILKYNSTTQKWENAEGGSAAVWGNITGTLSNQTDLATTLGTFVDKSSNQTITGTKNFSAISSSNIKNTYGTTILRTYAGNTEVGTTNTSLLLKSNLTRPYFNNTSTYLALLSDVPSASNFVTIGTDQDITGTKTFVGDKRIKFKQSASNNKLGFTLYDNNNNEKGYLEFNPSNTIDNAPLMTLGNYASSASSITQVGFRRYSSISGANGAYNLLTPLISDAKTPFSLTTTYTNFYLPLGFTDGVTTVKTAKSGLVDLSSILPDSIAWGNITGTLSNQTDLSNALGDKQDTLVSGTNIKTINNNSLLGNGNITIDSLPSQTGQSGKFLTTDGTDASWATVDALPSQSGNSGKLLTTNGSAASWTGVKTINNTSLLGSGDIDALQNTATGTNSLTILGTATSETASINIGNSSNTANSNSIAIGNNANTVSQYSVAIGYNAKAGTSSDSSNGAVAIGYNAGGDYSKGNTVAIGNNAVAKSTGSIAIGNSAEVGNTNYTNGIAIGEGSQVYGSCAIQLGTGANTTNYSMSVGFDDTAVGGTVQENWQLLDGTTGLIPDARISSNIARTPTYDSTNERLVFGS